MITKLGQHRGCTEGPKSTEKRVAALPVFEPKSKLTGPFWVRSVGLSVGLVCKTLAELSNSRSVWCLSRHLPAYRE